MAHLLESVCEVNMHEGHVEDLSRTVTPEDFESRVKSPLEKTTFDLIGTVLPKDHVDLEATVVPEVKRAKKVTIVEEDNALRDRVKYLERLVELLVEQRAPGSPEIIDVEVVDFRGKRKVVPAVAQRTVVVAKEREVVRGGGVCGGSILTDSVFGP